MHTLEEFLKQIKIYVRKHNRLYYWTTNRCNIIKLIQLLTGENLAKNFQYCLTPDNWLEIKWDENGELNGLLFSYEFFQRLNDPEEIIRKQKLMAFRAEWNLLPNPIFA